MTILALLDELRAMAETGLNFTDDRYDRERYERILELVDQYYGETLDVPPEEVRDRLADQLGQVTPKVASSAAVFDADDRVLLTKRQGTGTWCLPGGAVEIGEGPEECAVRETREETGLAIEPKGIAVVTDKEPNQQTPWHIVQHVYLGDVVEGELQASEAEVEELRYRTVEDVSDWFQNHRSLTRQALATRNGGASLGPTG